MEVFIGRVMESKKILGSFSFLKGGVNYGGFYSMRACYYVCIRDYICSGWFWTADQGDFE